MAQKRIIFAGTPVFATPCLNALLHSKHEVCAVYTQPDRPAGRGRKLQASPVKQLALTHGCSVYQPTSLKDPEAQATLAELQADLMVVVAYGLLLPQAVLDLPRLGCVNVHASLLPRWRGAAPIQRAVLAGDQTTGITLMQMAAGLDTGPMLAHAHCDINPTDTSSSLHDRLADLGAELLAQHLDHLEQLIPEPQDETKTCYAAKLEKAEAQLDWQASASELDRKVRAFNPWPVAQAEINAQTLRIWAATPLSMHHNAAPGTVLQASPDGLDMACGEGVLRVLNVQKPGGRAMPVRDFLNAQGKQSA